MIRRQAFDINIVAQLSQCSKFRRFLHNPVAYIWIIIYRNTLYKFFKKPYIVKTKLFWGKSMIIALPAATDIYLTGGKSHDSEIRLAKYLIEHVKVNSNLIDIGAHFGYFTLLVSDLAPEGMVLSYEPAPFTYAILNKNCANKHNIVINHKAVSNKNGEVTFYIYDILYSEYNSVENKQYTNETWYRHSRVHNISVPAINIDSIIDFKADFIKIDVEGHEYQIINGATKYLTKHNPSIILEIINTKDCHNQYLTAAQKLNSLGYKPYKITNQGETEKIDDLHIYILSIDSDNIVFKK